MTGPRLGFFTRLLEDAPAADRYRFALEQIDQAERSGFASAWIAQHHFGADEGGLPSPFVLLAAAAARTTRIALATGVVTLPLDDPLRVAEDAVVLDQLSGGRVQLGLATGGTPSSFAAFGRDSDRRREIFAEHFEVLLDALAGRGIRGTASEIYPAAGDLGELDVELVYAGENDPAAWALLAQLTREPVYDPRNDAALGVVDELARRHPHLAPAPMPAAGVAAACKSITRHVLARTLRHHAQPDLDAAASVAVKRPALDGGYTWHRAKSQGSIAELYAVTLAGRAASATPALRKPVARAGRSG